jgi:hypothetical protein
MWSVPVRVLAPEDVAKHLTATTCAPKPYIAGAKVTPFHIGFVAGGRLFLPPCYGNLAFPNATPTRNGYNDGEPLRPEVKFEGRLMTHPPQQAAMDVYKDHLARNPLCTACIVSLPCGYGKTPWFLAAAVEVGRVALVLVHKLPLLDQTIEEARRFLPRARVGYIKSSQVRVEGVDIIVGSIQTLASHLSNPAAHPYLGVLMRRVGMVCMDEGHHAIASTFATVFNTIPARVRLVLTATPRRKDDLMPQLQMIGGPVIFRAFRQVKEVHVAALEYVCADHVEQRVGALVQRWKMVEDLVDDEARTSIVCAIIGILLDQGRRILVVTPRVAHLHILADKLEALCAAKGLKPTPVTMFVPDKPPPKLRRPAVRKAKRPCPPLDKPDGGEGGEVACAPARKRRKPDIPKPPPMTAEEVDAANLAALYAWEDSGPHGSMRDFEAPVVGRVLQGMEQLDRELQYEARVLVTTTQMMEEGISCKKLDTLIDTDNTRDPEQVVGRILRTCPDKRVPLVLDLWIKMFQGAFYARMRHYKEEDFERHMLEAASVADLPPPEFWAQFDRPAPLAM